MSRHQGVLLYYLLLETWLFLKCSQAYSRGCDLTPEIRFWAGN